MIFMAVGDKDAANALFFVVQVARIGDNQVNAKHFIIGEHRTRINNHDVVAIFDDHHILSDLSQSSERDKSNIFCCQSKKNLLTTLFYVALLKNHSIVVSDISSLLPSPTEVKAKGILKIMSYYAIKSVPYWRGNSKQRKMGNVHWRGLRPRQCTFPIFLCLSHACKSCTILNNISELLVQNTSGKE